ncbi:polyprenol phosphomannose-dependent alpha 1,6 mannosyltransferase MptB [Planomonospora sphaerica]|uniref:polyprenol phosphomannose-dependent alpha 1,6 mannosyltransferase MptB n=1 Tax=Planomonospora sphaerica TaxID=161355 RepID=UPI001E43210C|nr:polyprenol phosphomannose-dependent alpha 1,6 mannosyltransferase MptB [Planomonospora sphaerica]
MTQDTAVAGGPVRHGARDALGVFAPVAIGLSAGLTVLIGLLGPSAMVPGLPGASWHPPYSLDAGPDGHLVIALAATAIALGGTGLAAALRSRWRPDPRLLLWAGSAVAALLALLPPSGSADHLNYAAYGRLAALGRDPYAVAPAAFPGDPVAGAVEEWAGVTSVYGPVATAVQALASLAGGDSVRLTVFGMALFNAAAFVGTGLLLHRLTAADADLQRRAALLWTANPLMIYHLSAGMHVDTMAVACMVAALFAFSSLRGAAGGATSGVLLGLGIGVKLNAGLVALGPAWELRRRPGRLVLVAGTATATVAAVYGIAGPHVLDQVGAASRKVSLGTPWQPVKLGLQSLFGPGAYAVWIQAGSVLLLAVLAWLAFRAVPGGPIGPGGAVPAGGRLLPPAPPVPPSPSTSAPPVPPSTSAPVRRPVPPEVPAPLVAAVIVVAWLFAAPYALPWYDGLAFALLAAAPAWPALEGFVVARTAILSLGYLPAREALRPDDLLWLKTVVRQQVVPWSLLALTAALLWWAARAGARARRRPA